MPRYEIYFPSETDADITVGARTLGVTRVRFIDYALQLLNSILKYMSVNRSWKLVLVDEDNKVRVIFPDVMNPPE